MAKIKQNDIHTKNMSKDLKIQTYFRAKPRSEENNGQYSKVRSYDQVLTNRK